MFWNRNKSEQVRKIEEKESIREVGGMCKDFNKVF